VRKASSIAGCFPILIYDKIKEFIHKKTTLKKGLAWHFRRYSKDEKLQAMEDQARAEKVALLQEILFLFRPGIGGGV
jgi:hypothetical protein